LQLELSQGVEHGKNCWNFNFGYFWESRVAMPVSDIELDLCKILFATESLEPRNGMQTKID
jgi:hypothetical protein